MSFAGLVPLLGLAEQTRLPEIIAGKVSITTPRIRSGAANPVPKLLSVIAGMCVGADSIDDLDVLRAGGMPPLFGGVYAPSTLGTLLREFTFGHASASACRSWPLIVVAIAVEVVEGRAAGVAERSASRLSLTATTARPRVPIGDRLGSVPGSTP